MSTIGTIYVLANPAIPGLIKVGKTTRSVDARMKELSSATGVASEFLLIYEQLFVDVDSAEKQIHTILEVKGFRHASNREFFNANPSDVIKIINSIKGKADEIIDESCVIAKSRSAFINNDEDDEFGELTGTEDHIILENFPWYEIWTEAENYYYGLNGYIRDFSDALEMYTKAIKMGCPFAFQRMGDMYLLGKGMSRTNKSTALEFYKQGVKHGDYYCYLKMGSLYYEDKNMDSTNKCFDYFIQNYSNFDKLIESENDTFSDLCAFIEAVYENYSFSINQKIFLIKHKERLIESNKKTIEYVKTLPENNGAYLQILKGVQKLLLMLSQTDKLT